jgi:hypothetical protein
MPWGDQRKGRSIGRLLEPIKVQEFMSLPLVLPESLHDSWRRVSG